MLKFLQNSKQNICHLLHDECERRYDDHQRSACEMNTTCRRVEAFYFAKDGQLEGVVANFLFTLTDLESFLRAISSIAVIVGAVFVVFQLRQNAKQIKQHEKTIEAMTAANRSRNAFELIGKVIDPSFPVRRHRLYEVSERYSGGDWTGFDRSLDDFEVRNFANIYEQMGLLVKKGVIDLQDVMNALSAQPMADWHAFQSLRKHIMEVAGKAIPSLATNQAGLDVIYWPNFMWLAEENAKWVRGKMSTGIGPGTQAK